MVGDDGESAIGATDCFESISLNSDRWLLVMGIQLSAPRLCCSESVSFMHLSAEIVFLGTQKRRIFLAFVSNGNEGSKYSRMLSTLLLHFGMGSREPHIKLNYCPLSFHCRSVNYHAQTYKFFHLLTDLHKKNWSKYLPWTSHNVQLPELYGPA